MKKYFLLACFFFTKAVCAQPPITWQKTIGGNKLDVCKKIIQTPDQGYLVVGYSNSNISGDKTVNSNGNLDIWLVKLNSEGQIVWQKTIGGSNGELVGDMISTSDGGYVLAASSSSDISGDKTENSKGLTDIWIVKINDLGVILWQKTIGGSSNDGATAIQETTDGGYIVGGGSASDISGDKTEPCFVSADFTEKRDIWVLKLDATGTIVWQNTIGGTLLDSLSTLKQTPDGGYLLGCVSASNISGDKTENAWGTSRDYWIIKIDTLGNIVWQKTIGGLSDDPLIDLVLTNDGGSIACGFSFSDVSGNKTAASKGATDYWIVKLNSTGAIAWQKTFGGSNTEFFPNIIATTDGNFILSGSSDSNISGDKTENSRGSSDIWLIKIDSQGNILWQKTIGGDQGEGDTKIIEALDGGYVIVAASISSISGEKTENCRGEADYWIIKLAPESLATQSFADVLDIAIYPNPTVKDVFISFKNEQRKIQVTIRNVLGELVSTQKYSNTNLFSTNIDGNTGIYFLTITIENLSKTYKIIKE
jgi:hypothetical protein